MTDAGDEIKFTLKVVINKQKNKVLFAEADSDFTDVLVRIVKVLEGHNGDKSNLVIGSLTTLYKGLSGLNDDYFWKVYDKLLQLNPISSFVAERVKLKLSVDYPQPPNDLIYEDMNCKRKSKRSRHASVESKTPVASDADDGDNNGGFTIKSTSFVISDDLQIFPVLPGSILRTLINLGSDETDGPELRTLILGVGGIVDLLKLSFLSKTPLTDFVFREKSRMDCLKQKLPQPASKEGSKKMTVESMFHKSTNNEIVDLGKDKSIEAYVPYLTGASLSQLAKKLSTSIGLLNTAMIRRFTNACLIAAATQRNVLVEFLSNHENVALADYVKKIWSINGVVNYSSLNMIGHCMLAAAGPTNNLYVKALRDKMNGQASIWDCDFGNCSFSAKQIEFFFEKVRRTKKEEAFRFGREIVNIIKGRLESSTS